MALLTHVAETLAPVIGALHTNTLPKRLTRCLMELTGAQDASLLRYREGHLPSVEYSAPLADGSASTLDAYITGPFLLDPFYRAATIDHQFGVFHLRDLAPRGFTESEYYRAWYKHCGFVDECGLLIKLKDGFVNVALGMRLNTDPSRPTKFYKSNLNLLNAVLPVIQEICVSHWDNIPQKNTEGGSLREKLHISLGAFGSSVLTRREQQVTELVLLGNSTRLIAEKLCISTETVKLHRKHAYAKLDVSSQAELFLLFMEALTYSPDSGGIDPLIAYHSKPA
jgi:DNA-binding CsgD family transcriptional regulator